MLSVRFSFADRLQFLPIFMKEMINFHSKKLEENIIVITHNPQNYVYRDACYILHRICCKNGLMN